VTPLHIDLTHLDTVARLGALVDGAASRFARGEAPL
jgi:hypothetical protein